jgi:hypothetical protein
MIEAGARESRNAGCGKCGRLFRRCAAPPPAAECRQPLSRWPRPPKHKRRLPQSVLPMQLRPQRCAPIWDTLPLHNQKCLYHHPRTACGSRRSLAVVPLIGDQRYYGETPMRLRRDCRLIRGNGPGGWRWVSGRRLAFWMSQPGLELPTETRATGQGARPRRSLASDSTGRQSLPRA